MIQTCSETEYNLVTIVLGSCAIRGVVHLSYQKQAYRHSDTCAIILCSAHLELCAITLLCHICTNNLCAIAILQQHARCIVFKRPLFVNSTEERRRVGSKVCEVEG